MEGFDERRDEERRRGSFLEERDGPGDRAGVGGQRQEEAGGLRGGSERPLHLRARSLRVNHEGRGGLEEAQTGNGNRAETEQREIRWLDLAQRSTVCPVKFKFQTRSSLVA